MRALTLIISPLLLLSCQQTIASSMMEDGREKQYSAISREQELPETEQRGMDINSKIFAAFNLHLVHSLANEEEEEEAIKKLFSTEEFKAISNKGWEAANEGHDNLAFTYMYLAAVGGLMADQQELANYFLEKKEYKKAAKWYIRSASNNNPDVLADLYRIDKESPILHYFNKGNLKLAEDILVNFWQEGQAS